MATTTVHPPGLFDPAAAADYLAISERTVRDFARAGRIGFVRIGGPIRGRMRFTQEQLDEYIRSQSQRGLSREAVRADRAGQRKRTKKAHQPRTAADVVAARLESLA